MNQRESTYQEQDSVDALVNAAPELNTADGCFCFQWAFIHDLT